MLAFQESVPVRAPRYFPEQYSFLFKVIVRG
jgi:hypothetical protein